MKKSTRNIFVKIAYILFIGMFMTLVISAKIKRDQQVVNDITVSINHSSGNFLITESEVLTKVSDLLPDSGALVHPEDLKELEFRLEEIPQSRSSRVFVNNTGHLSIEVIQRNPIYRVIKPNGFSYYVDEDGYKFPVTSSYTARVPVVTGFIVDDGDNATDQDRDLMKLFREFRRDKFWAAQFGQVYINDKLEIELIPRMGNHIVLLGDTNDLKDKLQRLRIFYHEGLTKAGWDTYKVINIKYKDQVVCKK